MDPSHHASPLSSTLKFNTDQANMLNSHTLSGGLLNSAFDGSLYTCMHQIEYAERLIAGTGNGSLRLINTFWMGDYKLTK